MKIDVNADHGMGKVAYNMVRAHLLALEPKKAPKAWEDATPKERAKVLQGLAADINEGTAA